MRMLLVAVLFGLLGLSGTARAVEPDEIMPDARLEARARTISAELRCLVCQNQSIDDSNAPLARDLRVLVRERLKAGDTDTAVRAFVVERYGTFVLLRPPMSAGTLLLWFAPLLLLLAGLYAGLRRMRAAAAGAAVPTAPPLSQEEQARLAKISRQALNRLRGVRPPR